MINFRNFLIFLLIVCSVSTYADTKNKAFRNFWHPTYLGERLDYCTVEGKSCGKEVADQYCQALGYDYSSQQVIAHNVGLTHYLGSRARCTGWRCNGFMTIGCAQSISHTPPKPYHYRQSKFVYPRFNDYRVDWCHDRDKGCGSKAAQSFCSLMGFIKATHFEEESNVFATKTIGSQELCFGTQCHAFKVVICSR